MRAYYSAETIAKNFATLATYELDGRPVSIIIGRENAFVVSAIDERQSERHSITGHQILAVLEMKIHNVHDETQFSEAAYWQSEDFENDSIKPLLIANLAARCDIQLITGAELAEVNAEEARRFREMMEEIMTRHGSTLEALSGVNESPEEQARRLQLYKIMRQEPPEEIAG